MTPPPTLSLRVFDESAAYQVADRVLVTGCWFESCLGVASDSGATGSLRGRRGAAPSPLCGVMPERGTVVVTARVSAVEFADWQAKAGAAGVPLSAIERRSGHWLPSENLIAMHIRFLAHGTGSTNPLKLDRHRRRSACRGSSDRMADEP